MGPKQYKQIWTGKNARTLELLREENEPKTPLDILIEEEDIEFDVARKKQKHLIKLIHSIMRKLTPRQRELVNLYFIKGKKHKEIAKQLGISQPSVSATITLAKRNLKKYLKKSLYLP